MSFFVSEEIKSLITESSLIENNISLLIGNTPFEILSVKRVKFYKNYTKSTIECFGSVDLTNLITSAQNVKIIKNQKPIDLKIVLKSFSKKNDNYLIKLKISF